MKNFLFVMSQAPHSGIHVQEQLDMVLITAAFDREVALLFLGDGVFQLNKAQQPESLGFKDTGAIFKALELYEVHDLFVETESLQERGLSVDDLLLPVKTVARSEISTLMQRYAVMSEV